MKTNANQRNPTKINDNHIKSMKTQLKSNKINENQPRSKRINENQNNNQCGTLTSCPDILTSADI